MRKLFFVFCLSLSALLSAQSFEDVKANCVQKLKTVHGWCSSEKATHMMDLIAEVKPTLCVEIGVFGGASILPTAEALKFNKKGVVFAIDPWSKEACLTGYEPNNPNYLWWGSLDLEAIYNGFLTLLKVNKLRPYCQVVRKTSKEALALFADESIDILHIDGNHTKDVALSDAEMYFPKVKKGGYIWFDDANWPTTAEAVNFLADYCEIIDDYSTNAYVLFRKNAE